MWLKCNINGDLINLDWVEEIEMLSVDDEARIDVVMAQKQRRKTVFRGTEQECRDQYIRIQQELI